MLRHTPTTNPRHHLISTSSTWLIRSVTGSGELSYNHSRSIIYNTVTWRVLLSRKDSFYQERARLVIESMMFGLAYAAGLCWASVCFLASFRPDILAMPYWSGIRYLRSDTCGVLAFFLVAIFLTCSEFLRLRRRASGLVRPPNALLTDRRSAAVFAVAETVAILARE